VSRKLASVNSALVGVLHFLQSGPKQSQPLCFFYIFVKRAQIYSIFGALFLELSFNTTALKWLITPKLCVNNLLPRETQQIKTVDGLLGVIWPLKRIRVLRVALYFKNNRQLRKLSEIDRRDCGFGRSPVNGFDCFPRRSRTNELVEIIRTERNGRRWRGAVVN